MSKHVLLTGSSKGIGKEIAILLLKQKFKVYGFSRSNSYLLMSLYLTRLIYQNPQL